VIGLNAEEEVMLLPEFLQSVKGKEKGDILRTLDPDLASLANRHFFVRLRVYRHYFCGAVRV